MNIVNNTETLGDDRDWRLTNLPHIVLQEAQDAYFERQVANYLQESKTKEHRLHQTNEILSLIEQELKKSRNNEDDEVDLRSLESQRQGLEDIWQQWQHDYPEYLAHIDCPVPPDLEHVSRADVERILSQLRNAQDCDQRAIGEIVRSLKLAGDLNELVGKIMAEQAKEKNRSDNYLVRAQLTNR